MKVINLVAIILLILSLNSCLSRYQKHGYMFDMSNQDRVQIGVTSQERLLKLMGSPTIVSSIDRDEAWVYYAEEVEKFLFFKPKIIDRNLLLVRFDDGNTVKEMKKLDLFDENQDIKFVLRYTPVDSHKENFIKSIVNNVGQVRPIQ